MVFVLDASVAAVWAFDDEDHPLAARASGQLRSRQAAVPSLWWFEIRNTVIVNERRGRIDLVRSARFFQLLARLPIRLDHAVDEATLLALARKHRLTVYDAAYLELAQRLKAPLATLDAALAAAATAEHLQLL